MVKYNNYENVMETKTKKTYKLLHSPFILAMIGRTYLNTNGID